jgi:hypothetical protein
MRFDGPARHFQLACDFGVVATLQEQLNNLLFPWTQPNRRLVHPAPFRHDLRPKCWLMAHVTCFTGIHSIHNAILRRSPAVTAEH